MFRTRRTWVKQSKHWAHKSHHHSHSFYHLPGMLIDHCRGLKTLALRVQQQNKNAMALAEALLKHSQGRLQNVVCLMIIHAGPAATTLWCPPIGLPVCAVERVHYPGLPSSPSHATASELLMQGGALTINEAMGQSCFRTVQFLLSSKYKWSPWLENDLMSISSLVKREQRGVPRQVRMWCLLLCSLTLKWPV